MAAKGMKIGLVCPYNIFKGGGVQECVMALKDGLNRRGHEALVITPQPRKHNGERRDGIILVGGATGVRSFHTTAQVSVSVDTEALQTMLDDEKFDVLHFHEPWVPILSRQILTRSASRNVATFHAKLPETVVTRSIERIITPYTRAVLKYLHELTAVSDAAAQYLSSLTTEPIEVVPNGIDLKKYKTKAGRTAAKDKKSILYVGRLEKRKGVIHLIRAFALLAEKQPVELILAGEGPDRSKLETYVAENRIPNVKFLGFVAESEKLRLLSEADLFCSPALYGESFGIVLLEAMAVGLPLVAGANPGYKSVMKGRGSISIADPENHADFARRLELLLNDEDLRKLWQEWAGTYVKQFDYDKVIDRYEKIYERALKTSN